MPARTCKEPARRESAEAVGTISNRVPKLRMTGNRRASASRDSSDDSRAAHTASGSTAPRHRSITVWASTWPRPAFRSARATTKRLSGQGLHALNSRESRCERFIGWLPSESTCQGASIPAGPHLATLVRSVHVAHWGIVPNMMALSRSRFPRCFARSCSGDVKKYPDNALSSRRERSFFRASTLLARVSRSRHVASGS